MFTAAPSVAAGWSETCPYHAPLMGAEDPLRQAAAAPSPLHSSCGLMARVPLPIMPQWEQVNGRGPKSVSPHFPGRAACHCHTPQWFLQHGSGPTPHGLAGQSVCLCICVCVRVCFGVVGGGV